jgi:hypothetical protein
MSGPDEKTTPHSLTISLFATLLASLNSSPSAASTNPLATASSNQRSLFITLHCLFPTALLPALDLLDRGLVEKIEIAFAGARDSTSAYYVRSSRPSTLARFDRHRHRSGGEPGVDSGTSSYEVRLQAWSCSCAAFAYDAFVRAGDAECEDGNGDGDGMEQLLGRGRLSSWNGGGVQDHESEEQTRSYLGLGGLERPGDGARLPPVCKHLLACALAEGAECFGRLARNRTVSKEEFAGLAAGWDG